MRHAARLRQHSRMAPDGFTIPGMAMRLAVLGVVLGCAVCVAQSSAQPSVARCKMGQLAVHALEITPPTGMHWFGLRFVNHGSRACALGGFPSIALRDAKGVNPFVYEHIDQRRGRVTLKAGGSAYVVLSKFRCDLTRTRRLAATGQVWLKGDPSRSKAFRPFGSIGICGRGDSSANAVNVSPFQPTLQAAVFGR
jgi:hypothetical protein